jgi:serine/threonine protein kinase
MPAKELANGQVLAGRYRVEAIIGRGGMAEVYRGVDERLARPVALKVLRGHYANDPGLRTRFEEEARAVAMVSHPNVVGVYDAGEDGDTAFIVMELVPGETFADRIARGPLDENTVKRIGGEVLDALAAAHARGVLHRDIKPANVLLTDDGMAKVADFGIAKAFHPSPSRNEPTTMNVLGTPSYLAPERAQGKPATVESDLWSVGVLLYEGLTGEKPFEADTPIAVAIMALEGRYQPVLERRPGTDPALAGVIDRALQADPTKRFGSAAEMSRALRGPAADETVALTPLATDADATQVLRPPTPTMVLGGLGLAAGGIAAGEQHSPTPPGGGPMTYGAAASDERFANDPPHHRNGLAIAAAVVAVLLVLGIGALLLNSALEPRTTVPPHISSSTSTTKPKPSSTSSTTTSSTTTSSTTTTVPASSTTTTSPTTTTTTVPPTTTTTAPTTTIAPTTTVTTTGPPST